MQGRLLASVSLGMLAIATPAAAQERAAGGATTLARGDAAVVREQSNATDDIIVTAQKREQSLQDVPIAISAVSTAALENANITSTNDLATVVPGLNVTRTTEAVNFTLRGIGTQGGSTGQDSAIATFVDGVYIPSMAGSNFALGNIERIEVLKGPQGTLYGRNATGGAVNVVTRDPSSTPSVAASIGYGNYNTVEGSFYGTTGLAKNVAIDLAAYYREQHDGFGRNRIIQRDVNATGDLIVRSKLVFEPTDATKITIAGDWARTRGSLAIAFRPVPTSQLLDGSNYASYLAAGNGYYDSISEFKPYLETKSYGGYGRIDQDLGEDFKLTNILAYRGSNGFQRVEVDATPLKIIDAPLFNEEDQLTNELQLAYSRGSIDAIAGLYYLDGTSQYNPFQIYGAAITGQTGGLSNRIVIFSKQKTKSYAAFGQVTWEFATDTNLTLGARYTIDKRRLEANQNLEIGGPVPGPYGENVKFSGALAPIGSVEQQRTFKKPTWRIAIDHRFTPDLVAYASYSRGVKSGVFNLTSPNDPAALPETLDAYELGLKTSPATGVTFNLASFYYKYRNIQAFQVNGANTTLTNAASARIYGIEADFTARLGGGFRLTGGISYLDHKYGNFPIATVSFLQQPAGAPSYPGYTPGLGNYVFPGCNNPAFAGQFFCSAAGNKLVNTPDITANLGLNHRLELGGGKSFETTVAYAYNDGFFWAVDNRARQRAYHNVNGQIQLNGAEDRWFVRGWVKNLIDEKYLVAYNENGSGDIGAPAPPRTYGATIGFKL